MIYPKGINGPDFDKGNLVVFDFDGASLSLKLPVIPFNHGMVDDLCSVYDFKGVDTSSWDKDIADQANLELAVQEWIFEDMVSYDDVASCYVRITITEIEDRHRDSLALLNFERFKAVFIEGLEEDFKLDEYADLTSPSYPSPKNNFFTKVISRPIIDALQSQLSMVTGSTPSPFACIAINERFFLNVSFHLKSLHYPDRKNPYSDELLRKMEFDIFNEFLNYINIQYSPETIAKIESLKQD